MKIAILGYDVEGKASYDYFAAQGHELTICDQNPNLVLPDGAASVLGQAYLNDLDRFDVIVRTAGLPPHLILDKNPSVANKITTHLNEFLSVCPTKNIIGVTGTKGKGTTSSLISEMLKATGKEVYLGGNIGVAPLTFLNQLTDDSWVVLEVSSFQSIDLQHSPHIGVCLMVVPEHLDWHKDMDEYIAAKANLFAHQSPDDTLIYFADNETSKQIVSASQGQQIPYFAAPGAIVKDATISIEDKVICSTGELKLLGKHNWQNICAAVTAIWQVSKDVEAIKSVLSSFTGLPHRLELVRELHGVKYYDDSFGTTPETATVAIASFTQPEIVILGGRGKGVPFDQLAEFISQRTNVKQVLVIGETAQEIAGLLRQNSFDSLAMPDSNIDQIVKTAQNLAEPGDVVLLSTACASFDMFDNYKQRGEMFSQAVQALV